MNPMDFKKRLVLGSILGLAMIALEFFIHRVLLSGAYMATASVWRPAAEMTSRIGLMVLAEFLFGVFFGVVYAQGYEPRRGPMGQGFRYGVIMGLMLAPINSLMWYAVLPVPLSLALSWLVYGFLEMIVLGLVASMLYKPAA